MAVELRVKKNDEWITLDPPENGFKIKYELVNRLFTNETRYGRENSLSFDILLTPKNKKTFDFPSIIEKESHPKISVSCIVLWNGIYLTEGILNSIGKIADNKIKSYYITGERLFKELVLDKPQEKYYHNVFGDPSVSLLDAYYDAKFTKEKGIAQYYFPYPNWAYDVFPMVRVKEPINGFDFANLYVNGGYFYHNTNENTPFVSNLFVNTAIGQATSMYYYNFNILMHGTFFEDEEMRSLVFLNKNAFFPKEGGTQFDFSDYMDIDYDNMLTFLCNTFGLVFSFIPNLERFVNYPHPAIVGDGEDVKNDTFRLDFKNEIIKNLKTIDYTKYFLPDFEQESVDIKELNLLTDDEVFLKSEIQTNLINQPLLDDRFKCPIVDVAKGSGPADYKLNFCRGPQDVKNGSATYTGKYPTITHDNLDANGLVIGNYSLEWEGISGRKENFFKELSILYTDNIYVYGLAWIGPMELYELIKYNTEDYLPKLIVDRVEYFIIDFSGSLKDNETSLFKFKLLKNNL